MSAPKNKQTKQPVLAMIAAMAHSRVIGKDNDMPWHMPADLKHFKQTTLGKPVIMGRKTYESIGKALPNRHNIVLTRQTDFALNDADVVSDIDSALALAVERAGDTEGELELMIIGGGALYHTLLPRASRLYLTHIGADLAGDTFFPDYLSQGTWQTVSEEAHPADERNPYSYTFTCLERV